MAESHGGIIEGRDSLNFLPLLPAMNRCSLANHGMSRMKERNAAFAQYHAGKSFHERIDISNQSISSKLTMPLRPRIIAAPRRRQGRDDEQRRRGL